jgi:hypothetical protein
MPAAKTESAETVRVRHYSFSYVCAGLHRAGPLGFSPSAEGVVTVVVALADSAVTSVDEEL